MVDRSASVLRHLAGLLGLPGVGRPAPAAGFHSHNCTRLELSFGGEQGALTESSEGLLDDGASTNQENSPAFAS